MLALAAGLWLVYLVPSMLKRREYLATERNAVRLQQTLRVLAESAEVPVEVHAETSARSVATLQRGLRQQQQLAAAVARARVAAAARTASREVVEAPPARAAVVSSVSLASKRLRRTRAATSLILLGSVATLVVQLVLAAVGGFGAGAPTVLAFAAVGALTSFALLGRLASVSRARAAALVPKQQARVVPRAAPVEQAPARPAVEKAWTPVPVPKPLYLSRPAAAPVTVVVDEVAAELREAALREAAAATERAVRTAPAATVTPIARPSRFAAMEQSTNATPDLDAVLRRRRAAS